MRIPTAVLLAPPHLLVAAAYHLPSTCLADSPGTLLHSFALDGPGSEVVDMTAADDGDGSAPSDRLVLGMPAAVTAAAIREHPATTAEVRQLCGDLQVLGRSEFKALLKWCAASLAAHCPRLSNLHHCPEPHFV